MQKLKISDDGFKLPLDVITMATAILGLRGSGKTNTAGVWTEELLKQGQQVIVVDPQNVWWGLKSSADGKSEGFPIVIFGGNHADIPITGTEGKAIADFVVEKQVSCVLSLRHLSLSAQRKFVTAFTEQLFFRKGEEQYQNPCLVVIDEAHKFVPQKVQGGDMAMLVHRIQMLVTEGRASGLGVCLIDQRAATVNKDVLTQVELMVVHRTVGPQDKKALDEWIRDNAEEGQAQVFKESLAGLTLGKAWFWSVGWLKVFEQVQVRKRETFDSSATPRPGEKRVEPKKLAPVDLDDLRESLAESVAVAEANDPKKLKSEIARLQNELATTKRDLGTELDQLREAHRQALEKGSVEVEVEVETFPEALAVEIGKQMQNISDAVSDVIAASSQIAELMHHAPRRILRTEPQPRDIVFATPPPMPIKGRSFKESMNGVLTGTMHKIGKSEMAVLKALYWTKDDREIDNTKIAFFAGYSPTASTVGVALSKLRAAGLVEGKGLKLTPEGLMAIPPDVEPKPTGRDLADWVLSRVGKSEREVLTVLIGRHGERFTNEQLAQATGYSPTASTIGVALSKLRKFEAIEGSGRDGVRAADIFFQ